MQSSIKPTLPGDEYGLRISDDKSNNGKIFIKRKDLIKYCAHLCPPNPQISEVGVFQGYLSEYLLDTFKPSILHLIDTFNTNDHVSNKFKNNTHYNYINEKFINNKNIKCHKGLSWDMLNNLDNNSLDYIYIDADHSYNSVKKDIEVAYKKIKNGGIIQFNDYTHFGSYEKKEYGVMHAVNEFIEKYNVHIIGLSIDRSGYHDIAVIIYKNIIELNIVTPCSRPENLELIKKSINFDLISKWYIIYDTRNNEFKKKYENTDKIIELECKDEGIVGHQIRNMSLNLIKNGFIYYLDDDNIVHPELWNIFTNFENNYIYTFDLIYNDNRILKGNNPIPNKIDTSQYLFDVSLVGNIKFNQSIYNADGIFINNLINNNKDKWKYIENISAYYNKLR